MIKAPDNIPNQIYARYIDEEHQVELGIHMVLFGWRIRAGYLGHGDCRLDYCCGNDPKMVSFILSMCKTILETNNCDFKVFPYQERKPVFNDSACFSELIALTNPTNFELLDIPDLTKLRRKVLDLTFINEVGL